MPRESSNLLSARNAIIAAAGLAIVSLAAVCASLFSLNDSNGWGRDTYGTRGVGFRGVYELLQELRIQVERSGGPPLARSSTHETLAFLDSNPDLVAVNPSYIEALSAWIERGGRVVVAPGSPLRSADGEGENCEDCSNAKDSRDMLELLKIDAIVKVIDDGDSATGMVAGDAPAAERRIVEVSRVNRTDERDAASAFGEHVHELAVPAERCARLEVQAKDLCETLTYRTSNGDDRTLAAVIKRGAGEIVVVAEPAVFANANLGQADNSVLAANLLAAAGRKTCFDEFYHGLSVRGNPLYVLTKPGFAALALGLALTYAGVSWRMGAFLGPPLPAPQAVRRHIGEYVNAMGRFFLRAPDSGPFLLREIRDGVLRHWCQELGLPLETSREATILAALRRHDPQAAARLEAVLAESNSSLASAEDRRPPSLDVSLLQRLAACL
jgi:hypothetical protein